MIAHAGKRTLTLENRPYLLSHAAAVGKKEGEGPLGSRFDFVTRNDRMGQKSWELAESELQRTAIDLALRKGSLRHCDLDLILAGDLLNQCIGSFLASMHSDVPYLGQYGACSTMAESLLLAAALVDAGFADTAAALTSSHFASAERQYRFPLGYGGQRTPTAQWTVTGSGCCMLGAEGGSSVRMTHVLFGKMIELGVKDANNMGAAMAMAALDTILQNFRDLGVDETHYDKIITGDLGSVGQTVLIDLLREKGIDIADRHMDCGIEIFDAEAQDTHAGGSGCGCSAVTLAAYILPKLESGEWKKVLFLPTGALLSKTSFNEGKSVPGIAHAVVLESPAVK